MAQAQGRGLLLRLIALFKFVKAILLIATGVGALHFVHTNLTQSAERFLDASEFIKKLEMAGFKEIKTKTFM